MQLHDLLTPRRIKVPIVGLDKNAVIRELVGLVVDNGAGEFEHVLRAVEEREAVLSTGIGCGVAIPHGKTSRINEIRLAAGASQRPVPFDALDGEPVRLFFLLIGPETSAGDHVKALSRISRVVRRQPVRERLLAARDSEEFFRTLCDAEGR